MVAVKIRSVFAIERGLSTSIKFYRVIFLVKKGKMKLSWVTLFLIREKTLHVKSSALTRPYPGI